MPGKESPVESGGREAACRVDELQARDAELARLRSDLAWVEREVLDRDVRSASLSTQLVQYAEQLQAVRYELASVRASRSWYVTAPLRAAPRLLPGRFTSLLLTLYWLMNSQVVKRIRERNRRVYTPDADAQSVYGGLQASGLFDARFYGDGNRKIAEAASDPLLHFIDVGAVENRDPNPLFDTAFYLKTNPEVARAGINPLYHYLTVGAAEGRNPNPLFDSALYADDFRDSLPADTNPLAHYISDPDVARGLARLLRSGNLRFDWTDYRRQLAQSMFCYTAERKSGRVGELRADDHFARAIIVAAKDAEPFDSQLVALSVVRELVTAHDVQVFVLLKRGGPLTQQFVALAPTVVLQTGSTEQPLSDEALDDLLTILYARGADAAICYGVMTGDLAERLKSHGLRVVTAIHELPGTVRVHGMSRLLEQTYTNSDSVLFPAQVVQDRLASVCSLSPRSVRIRPPGILQPNPFTEEREFARFQVTKQLNIARTASIVLGCGYASQRTGFDLFIQMARLVTERMVDEDVHFVWLGDEDRDFTAWCREDVVSYGLADRVHTPGLRRYSGLFHAASDVFVLSSREDAYPTVCLEAMEAGLPVVGFQSASGIGDAIGADAGVLVPYLDVQAMAAFVEQLIADPELRVRLGSRGKQRIKQHFQLSEYVDFLLGVMDPSAQFTEVASPAPDQVAAHARAS